MHKYSTESLWMETGATECNCCKQSEPSFDNNGNYVFPLDIHFPFPCTRGSSHPQRLLLRGASCFAYTREPQHKHRHLVQLQSPFPTFLKAHTLYIYTHILEANQSLEYNFPQHISLKNKKVHCWLCTSKWLGRENNLFFSMLRTKYSSQSPWLRQILTYPSVLFRNNMKEKHKSHGNTTHYRSCGQCLYPICSRNGLFYYYGSKSNQMSLNYLHLTHTRLSLLESLLLSVNQSLY